MIVHKLRVDPDERVECVVERKGQRRRFAGIIYEVSSGIRGVRFEDESGTIDEFLNQDSGEKQAFLKLFWGMYASGYQDCDFPIEVGN